jgi:LCP family protein required for cell wall assembly
VSSREETAPFPQRSSRQRTRGRRTRRLTLAQRLMFVFALVTFGLASAYTSAALVSRVTPALFPGKTLGSLVPHLGDLSAIGITPPDNSSVFNRRINLLIGGVDPEEGSPDSIMVASIDPASHQMSILGIPRDLWVDLHPPGGGVTQGRINEAYLVGKKAGGDSVDAGARQVETELKDNFGIAIDYYLWLNIPGVEKLVDAIGGIDPEIPPDLAVPSWYYTDDDVTNPHWVSFPPGRQHLTGYNAVAFGRYRNDSDFYRIKRQQLVVKTAMEKVFERGLLNNPLDLWSAYGSLVQTDVPEAKLPGYGLLLKDSQGSMRFYSLGDPVNGAPTVTGWVTPGGADVLNWNPDNVQYWLAQAFSPSLYVGSNVEVRAADGSLDSAKEVAIGHYLEFKGLPTVELGPDDPTGSDTHVQIVGDSADRRQLAQDVAKWLQLPPSAIEVAPRADSSEPDLVISVGGSFKLPS